MRKISIVGKIFLPPMIGVLFGRSLANNAGNPFTAIGLPEYVAFPLSTLMMCTVLFTALLAYLASNQHRFFTFLIALATGFCAFIIQVIVVFYLSTILKNSSEQFLAISALLSSLTLGAALLYYKMLINRCTSTNN